MEGRRKSGTCMRHVGNTELMEEKSERKAKEEKHDG